MTKERLMTLLVKLFIEIEECREIEDVLENIEMSKKEYEEIIAYEIPKTQEQIFLEIIYQIDGIIAKNNPYNNKLVFYKTYNGIYRMMLINFHKKTIELFNIDETYELVKTDLEILKPLKFTIYKMHLNKILKEDLK